MRFIFISIFVLSYSYGDVPIVISKGANYPVRFIGEDERYSLIKYRSYAYSSDKSHIINDAHEHLASLSGKFTSMYLSMNDDKDPRLNALINKNVKNTNGFHHYLGFDRIKSISDDSHKINSFEKYGKYLDVIDFSLTIVNNDDLKIILNNATELKVVVLPFILLEKLYDIKFPHSIEKIVFYNSIIDDSIIDHLTTLNNLKEVVFWGCHYDGGVKRNHNTNQLFCRLKSLVIMNSSKEFSIKMGQIQYPEVTRLEVSSFYLAAYFPRDNNFPKLEDYIYHAVLESDDESVITYENKSKIAVNRLSNENNFKIQLIIY